MTTALSTFLPESSELAARSVDHPILASLPQPVRDEVLAASKIAHHRANRTWLRAREPAHFLYFLIRGSMRVFHRASPAAELTIELVRAPAVLGAAEVLRGTPLRAEIRTLEPSELICVPAALAKTLARTQPRFAELLLLHLAERADAIEERCRSLAFDEIEDRLAAVLLEYGRTAGTVDGDRVTIEVPLSQLQLARDLGVTRKPVQLALARFKAEGLVKKERGRYVVASRAALIARLGRARSAAPSES